ncbi:MAG: hypothetical protein KAS32_04250 [Candidatus Peribacteraceae bacterium]|nr:hypothetical protein [Candidatus Peribacteraceae bacterium]
MGVKYYTKKPVEIEAIQFTGETLEECCHFIGENNLNDGTSKDEGYIGIVTLEGDHEARYGDWIIKGVKGEFYPCKPDIFEMTYELSKTQKGF